MLEEIKVHISITGGIVLQNNHRTHLNIHTLYRVKWKINMINTSFPSQNLLIWYPNFGDKDQEMIVSWTEVLHVSCMLEFSVFRCYLCWWPLIPRKDITIWMGWIHFLSSFPNFTSNGSASPLQSVGWVQVRSIQWWIWVSNNYATVKRSADTGEALWKLLFLCYWIEMY